jgi:hypothetical protein
VDRKEGLLLLCMDVGWDSSCFPASHGLCIVAAAPQSYEFEQDPVKAAHKKRMQQLLSERQSSSSSFKRRASQQQQQDQDQQHMQSVIEMQRPGGAPGGWVWVLCGGLGDAIQWARPEGQGFAASVQIQ